MNLNRHFFKEDTQMTDKTHEKMLDITNHQGITNQNYNWRPIHSSQDGYYQTKLRKIVSVGEYE